MSGTSCPDIAKELFQRLTGELVDDLSVFRQAPVSESWLIKHQLNELRCSTLEVTLDTSYEQVSVLVIYDRSQSREQQKSPVLLKIEKTPVSSFLHLCSDVIFRPEQSITIFCSKVVQLAYLLANGLDETPTQPVRYEQVPSQRDDQVVMELASSARRKPDPVPYFRDHRIC